MKSSKIARMLLLTTLFAFLSAGSLWAFGKHWGWGRYSVEEIVEMKVDKTVDFLDLDENQTKVLNRIYEEGLAKHRELMADKKLGRQIFFEELKSEQFDDSRLVSLIERNRGKAEEMMIFRIRKFAEFHRVLRPEQKAKLVEKIEKFRKWRQKWAK
ncbi:MAG: periplasmic heavy metal sensor [Proteobacteria bacterium]|nr:periplasmic heavy metal sensor [Pseudomonadota bacterium]